MTQEQNLLLLFPAVAVFVAVTRQIIGVRGFGIFIPASLAVVFLALGPILGILIFAIMFTVSLLVRLFLIRFKIKLQYLPRMSLLIWFMSVSVLLFSKLSPIFEVSIFPVLFLVLLVEEFTRVQLGKSFRTAFNLTLETILLALGSYLLLRLPILQSLAVTYPIYWLLGLLVIIIMLGNYSGLRLLEIFRFRKLL